MVQKSCKKYPRPLFVTSSFPAPTFADKEKNLQYYKKVTISVIGGYAKSKERKVRDADAAKVVSLAPDWKVLTEGLKLASIVSTTVQQGIVSPTFSIWGGPQWSLFFFKQGGTVNELLKNLKNCFHL